MSKLDLGGKWVLVRFRGTTNDKNTTTNDFEAKFLSEITPQATRIEVNDNTKSPNLKQIADVLKSKFHVIFLFFNGCHLLCLTK